MEPFGFHFSNLLGSIFSEGFHISKVIKEIRVPIKWFRLELEPKKTNSKFELINFYKRKQEIIGVSIFK